MVSTGTVALRDLAAMSMREMCVGGAPSASDLNAQVHTRPSVFALNDLLRCCGYRSRSTPPAPEDHRLGLARFAQDAASHRGDGAVSVIDRHGRRLKIPMWMLSPCSADIPISQQALLNKDALLSLSTLLSALRQRDHDNLQPIAVNSSEGGRGGATRTDGPDDPTRNPSRARKPDRSGRSGRSDGALSRSGISSRKRRV